MNGLFGLELPTSVNFVIAFVVVLALIGAATWLVRRFGAPRLEAGGRNRQPRLAVLDSAAVDGRRKLVIIRRDNVEHLLMIGGPTDVVVETNIVRSPPGVARETPAVRVNGGETLPRAMPLPDTTHWPLQPEPSVPARPERVDPSQQWPEPAAIPAVAPPPPAPVPAPVLAPVPPPAPAPTLRAQREPPAGLPADPVHAAPPVTHAPMPNPAAPRPAPAPRPAAKPAPMPQADPQTAAVNDENLASMAQQLEAALRRPVGGAAPPEPARRIEPTLRPPAPKPAAPAPAAPAAAPKPQPTHSIEQEMASLLGRPGEKLTRPRFAACVRLATAAAIALLSVPAHAQDISINFGQGAGLTERVIQLIALLTVLSLAPSILVMMTSFTRIVVVLSLLRTALGTATAPPNAVIISLALFLTGFVMWPAFQTGYEAGVRPLLANEITVDQAFERASQPFRTFMLKHVRDKDLKLFNDMANEPAPPTPEQISLRILIPAFMISELKRAFEIGFLLFLPFLIIDLVVASVLMSMGMMMLPPVVVSLPFKLIFFVLVDGWSLVAGSLIQSYGGSG